MENPEPASKNSEATEPTVATPENVPAAEPAPLEADV